jgi:hypothetical protein
MRAFSTDPGFLPYRFRMQDQTRPEKFSAPETGLGSKLPLFSDKEGVETNETTREAFSVLRRRLSKHSSCSL